MVVGRSSNRMTANLRADGRATDPRIYLPAGITPSVGTDRLERLWNRLFDPGVEPPE